MIDSIKCFSKIDKYSTAKFIVINGLANRFGDRNKSMGRRTFFSETKLKWIENYYFFQTAIQATINNFLK